MSGDQNLFSRQHGIMRLAYHNHVMRETSNYIDVSFLNLPFISLKATVIVGSHYDDHKIKLRHIISMQMMWLISLSLSWSLLINCEVWMAQSEWFAAMTSNRELLETRCSWCSTLIHGRQAIASLLTAMTSNSQMPWSDWLIAWLDLFTAKLRNLFSVKCFPSLLVHHAKKRCWYCTSRWYISLISSSSSSSFFSSSSSSWSHRSHSPLKPHGNVHPCTARGQTTGFASGNHPPHPLAPISMDSVASNVLGKPFKRHELGTFQTGALQPSANCPIDPAVAYGGLHVPCQGSRLELVQCRSWIISKQLDVVWSRRPWGEWDGIARGARTKRTRGWWRTAKGPRWVQPWTRPATENQKAAFTDQQTRRSVSGSLPVRARGRARDSSRLKGRW